MNEDKPIRKPLTIQHDAFDHFNVDYKVREHIQPWKHIRVAVDVIMDHTSLWQLVQATVTLALQKEERKLRQAGTEYALSRDVHKHIVTRHKVDKSNLIQLLEGLPEDMKEALRKALESK